MTDSKPPASFTSLPFELKAKVVAMVLYARRASPPIFRFTIVPTYGHHIREVNFYNNASNEGSDNALSAMGQSPVLDTLGLQSGKALELFGSFQNPDQNDSTTTYRARMLAILSPKIKTLELHNFNPAEASAVVRRFPNLTALGLIDLENARQADDISDLFSAIASARGLSSLAIDRADDVDSDWPSEALAPLERDPPPIKTLQLLDFPLEDLTFRIISCVASTLERLSLQAVETDQPQPLDLSSITPLRLPHLSHLNLYIQKELVSQLPRILTSSSTLSYVSLLYIDESVDSTDPAILSFLDSQPTLRLVHLEEFTNYHPLPTFSCFQPPAPSHLADYSHLVHSRSLDSRVLDKPHLTPFDPDASLDYTKNEISYLAEVLDRTLDFGRIELKRKVAEGSVASAVEWVKMLKPLEEKRLAWKD
ncbi:hypothetical protein RQP46_002523 [Phenoliferia psychrophenolica]